MTFATFLNQDEGRDIANREVLLSPEFLGLPIIWHRARAGRFAAVRLDVIDDDVAIRSPPFGAIIDAVSVQQRCRVYGAVGDAAGKSRRISAE